MPTSYPKPTRQQLTRRRYQGEPRTPNRPVTSHLGLSPRGPRGLAAMSSRRQERLQQHRRTSSNPKVPIVSPTNNASSSSPMIPNLSSWDDACDRSVASDMGHMYSLPLSSDRSVVSESCAKNFVPDDTEDDDDDDDMPMDEMADTIKTLNGKATEMNRLKLEAAAFKQENMRLQSILHHSRSFDGQSSQGSHNNPRPPVVPNAVDHHSTTPTSHLVMDDDVSSLGGVEDTSSSLRRMAAAIQTRSSVRPAHLTAEETKLWNALQSVLRDDAERIKNMARKLEETSADLEARVNEATQQALQSQQEQHDHAIRAIQRVLADVTTKRDNQIEEYKQRMETLEQEKKILEQRVHSNNTAAPGRLAELEQKCETLKRNLDIKTRKVVQLERDLKAEKTNNNAGEELQDRLKDTEQQCETLQRNLDAKSKKLIKVERELLVTKASLSKFDKTHNNHDESRSNLEKQLQDAHAEIESLKSRQQTLQGDLESKSKQVMKLKRHIHVRNTTASKENHQHANITPQELDALHKELQEKDASLENAKKIIASLELANGSLAMDMRAKLKGKEEELASLLSEAGDRKRTLDSLATELRELQRKQAQVDQVEKVTQQQLIRYRALSSQLENSIADLQSAAIVLESSPDTGAVEPISDILFEILASLKTTVEATDDEALETDSVFSTTPTETASIASEVHRQVDALIRDDREAASRELKNELDQKRLALKRLEEAHRKQQDEIRKLRAETERKLAEKEKESLVHQREIQTLREQCQTNMEVLTRKERELGVLRDSLKVDDNDGGYISDDVTDGEDEEEESEPPPVSSPPRYPSIYGASQTEALATLLVHSGSGIEVSKGSITDVNEMHNLRSELVLAQADKEKAERDLEAEKESLANAKMIISSLEKANKSMMEDLRSRLQDSNTAIASLLDKSMEAEKTTKALQKEIERLKKEKEDDKDKFQVSLKKLKDEALVSSLRLSAKDRELEDLRMKAMGVQSVESTESGSMEEKKEAED